MTQTWTLLFVTPLIQANTKRPKTYIQSLQITGIHCLLSYTVLCILHNRACVLADSIQIIPFTIIIIGADGAMIRMLEAGSNWHL